MLSVLIFFQIKYKLWFYPEISRGYDEILERFLVLRLCRFSAEQDLLVVLTGGSHWQKETIHHGVQCSQHIICLGISAHRGGARAKCNPSKAAISSRHFQFHAQNVRFG